MGYIGKDVVHEGCGLPINPDYVLSKLPSKMIRDLRRTERRGVYVRQVSGNANEIEILKSMWYDPEDPNIPDKIRESEFMFIAYNKENIPVGITILLTVGNHLFLNNLAANPEGKLLRVPDYILWFCVNHFFGSQFKYIDVGVSFRPSLYGFFEKWKVASYPILFYPPEIKIEINDYPFSSILYNRDFDYDKWEDSLQLIKKLTNINDITFVPNEDFAKGIAGADGEDLSYLFPLIPNNKPTYVSLNKIFNLQYGCLVFGKDISDKEMWNNYGCLDVFKRRYCLASIYKELIDLDDIIEKRKKNFSIMSDFFNFEDIIPELQFSARETIPTYYYFKHERNSRYDKVLDEFSIKHKYFPEQNVIGLPIHQNLTYWQLEYMYGIFRGVLNLCSEWTHTDVYGQYKS